MIDDDLVKEWAIKRLNSNKLDSYDLKLLRLFVGLNILERTGNSLIPLNKKNFDLNLYVSQKDMCPSTSLQIGKVVVYTGLNGYTHDHDNDLEIGKEYIVRDFEVDHSSTKVWLVGYDGYNNSFNSVIFTDPLRYKEWVQEQITESA